MLALPSFLLCIGNSYWWKAREGDKDKGPLLPLTSIMPFLWGDNLGLLWHSALQVCFLSVVSFAFLFACIFYTMPYFVLSPHGLEIAPVFTWCSRKHWTVVVMTPRSCSGSDTTWLDSLPQITNAFVYPCYSIWWVWVLSCSILGVSRIKWGCICDNTLENIRIHFLMPLGQTVQHKGLNFASRIC